MTVSTQPLHPPYRLEIGVISQEGNSHKTNEDCYRLDAERGLFLLADGMGGHRAGEVASHLAVEVLYHTLVQSSPGPPKEMLGNALMAAHLAIREKANEESAYFGMGTTALIGWIRLPEYLLWTAHVGNSRAYRWRNGTLQQLTEDHTMLNELRKANRLPANRRDWPSPVVLSQALGSRQPFLSPGFGEWPLQIADRILFCSDGVSDVLSEQQLLAILSETAEPQQLCERLAQAVREKGAPDDYTAILVELKAVSRTERTIQTVQLTMEEVEKCN